MAKNAKITIAYTLIISTLEQNVKIQQRTHTEKRNAKLDSKHGKYMEFTVGPKQIYRRNVNIQRNCLNFSASSPTYGKIVNMYVKSMNLSPNLSNFS